MSNRVFLLLTLIFVPSTFVAVSTLSLKPCEPSACDDQLTIHLLVKDCADEPFLQLECWPGEPVPQPAFLHFWGNQYTAVDPFVCSSVTVDEDAGKSVNNASITSSAAVSGTRKSEELMSSKLARKIYHSFINIPEAMCHSHNLRTTLR